MDEVKDEWEVIAVGIGYVVARNGPYGYPDLLDHYYMDEDNAQHVADQLNGHADITDAPRFNED
ncbi:hypothetical protein [Allisonella histaminiformans]|uniref:hypothetical protein n=1 Tax=Allisonella histaminiformans TaxID=209880 RepID=UPI002803B5E2|nr:hypothetical protein [Allisonella histaminiformans]